MKQTRRLQAALEQEAMLRLARFERVEQWEGFSPGDPVRITGHRGGSWRFRAFVTNTSNGASWVEVAEVMAKGRHASRRTAPPPDPDAELPDTDTTAGAGAGAGAGTAAVAETGTAAGATRTRSFRPELVVPFKRSRRRRRAAPPAPQAPPGPSVQASLFDYL
jgi:hypothetical protein